MFASAFMCSCFLAAGVATSPAEPPGFHRLRPVPIGKVVIDDRFWSPRLEVWRGVTIPDCFAKFEKDGALTNFDKVRDGAGGTHGGPPWYDGLIYEMIRGSADFLAARPDPGLEARLDGYIDRIAAAAARDPNGYINTHTQLVEPAHRWGLNGGDDNMQHDVYNAGALVEAGVHYYRATGKTKLLQVGVKLANHMADVMGPPPKQNIVPGHSIGEEALVKLAVLLREQAELQGKMDPPADPNRYLELARFWIENRGNHAGRKSYGPYGQDHLPVLQQTTIEGHAVRATLLCTGLTAAANVMDRADYLQAAARLWSNMVDRRMYVIGGLGAVAGYEGFGPDYVLPNNGYLETCAAIGAGFFHQNMNNALGDARYADEFERVLYNAVLPGVSLKGDTYFYENPLEAGPNRQRWAWHGCPCCPPMFLKIMGALPQSIYATDESGVYVNLFIGSRAEISRPDGKVKLSQTTGYPWDGAVKFTVEPERETSFTLFVRLPGWCGEPKLTINGEAQTKLTTVRGYAALSRAWRPGDKVELTLDMPIERLKANPKVEADRGRVALRRGPLVYCVEAVDNNGAVRNLVIPADAKLSTQRRDDLLGGITVIQGDALAVDRVDWPESLYQPEAAVPGVSRVSFTAIPYFANANREPGEMEVWVAEDVDRASPRLAATIASTATATASHVHGGDTIASLNDQIEPAASDDQNIPRFTWWDHRGTREWVQYDFQKPTKVSAVSVYWWDERRINANCRIPASWRLYYRDGESWKAVEGASNYSTTMDTFDRVEFPPITTSAMRLEVQLQAEWSGGILEWKVE